MRRKITYFAIGTIVGPLVTTLVRPALLSIIKSGMILGYEARNIAQQAREDLQDISAEAAASASAAPAARK